VRGDRVQLQQVILSLLMNAFQAMKDCPLQDREVVVHGEVDGANGILATVRDRGIGLGRDQARQNFSSPSTQQNGMGWAWDFPSPVRSSKRTAAVCGQRTTWNAARPSTSPCQFRLSAMTELPQRQNYKQNVKFSVFQWTSACDCTFSWARINPY